MAEQLQRRGRRVIKAVTYRARFWSVVRCYATDDGLVWFKETNPGHGFEAGLTAAMAKVAPDLVAVPLAVEPRRGWLLTDDHGPTLWHEDVEDRKTLVLVVRELARLQTTLHAHVDPADVHGVAALAPAAAGSWVRDTVHRWSTLPGDHPLHADGRIVLRAERAAAILDARTSVIDGSVPAGLDLNDVYAANICADRSGTHLRLRFFDFGNAVWGHPFVTLHGFLESVEEWNEQPLPMADRAALGDAYVSVWTDRLGLDPAGLHRELEATRDLAHVHRVLAWLQLVPHADDVEMLARGSIPRRWMDHVLDLAG